MYSFLHTDNNIEKRRFNQSTTALSDRKSNDKILLSSLFYPFIYRLLSQVSRCLHQFHDPAPPPSGQKGFYRLRGILQSQRTLIYKIY